jgi:T-complex protein 1 subunit beta
MVTNDGATILRSIVVDNPAAKVLIDIAKIQDDEVGDGTTSVTVLAGELLREAEKLINLRIHPMVVIDGWRRAAAVARAALEASSLDHGADPDAFRADLMNIARTTLSSKLLTHEKDQFGELKTRREVGTRGQTAAGRKRRKRKT